MIRVIGFDDPMPEFAANAVLESVRNACQSKCAPSTRRFAAFDGDAVVGVSHYRLRAHWALEDGMGKVRRFPPIVYFFGTEVAAGSRSNGVGSILYEHRLRDSLKWCLPKGVEILGSGAPGSVHQLSLPGLFWHLERGFEQVGFSLENDRGPGLLRGP